MSEIKILELNEAQDFVETKICAVDKKYSLAKQVQLLRKFLESSANMLTPEAVQFVKDRIKSIQNEARQKMKAIEVLQNLPKIGQELSIIASQSDWLALERFISQLLLILSLMRKEPISRPVLAEMGYKERLALAIDLLDVVRILAKLKATVI